MSEQLEIKQMDQKVMDISGFAQMEKITVETDQDAEKVSTWLLEIKGRLVEIKKQRDFVIKPLKEHVKKLETKAKQSIQPLQDLDKSLRSKIGVFLAEKRKEEERKERERREKEKKEAQEKADQLEQDALDTGDELIFEKAVVQEEKAKKIDRKPMKVSSSVKTSAGQVTTQVRWDWKLTNLDKVPKEYLVLNEKKINALAKGYKKNPVKIEGIEFYEKTTTVVR